MFVHKPDGSLTHSGAAGGIWQQSAEGIGQGFDSRFNFQVELFDQLRAYADFSQSSLGGSVTWGYPIIEPEKIWNVATIHIPVLIPQIELILAKHPPRPSPIAMQ